MLMLRLLTLSTKFKVDSLFTFLRSYNSRSYSIENAQKALHQYTQMQRKSISFDSYSILLTLKSTAQFQNLAITNHLHAHLLKLGFNYHVYVATSLLHSYVLSCFRDARYLFDEMPEKNTVTWNTMISGYCKSGDVLTARLLFDEMPLRNIASWSSMISGYINNGYINKGSRLFQDLMMNEELKPDQLTLISILGGCIEMDSHGFLLGKSIHSWIIKNMGELTVKLGSTLVHMYAKCGYLKCARQVFDEMPDKNVYCWTALICGFSQHGYGKEALYLFEEMIKAGIKPTELTFTGVLSACSQTGLIEEGKRIFKRIKEYDLSPRIQHYGCMVDMYAKSGHVIEAYEIIKTMPFEPNAFIWGSFLLSCKAHKQFEMVDRVIDRVLETLNPKHNGGVYSLICDLYVLCFKFDEAQKMRNLMTNQNVIKVRGSSVISSGI